MAVITYKKVNELLAYFESDMIDAVNELKRIELNSGRGLADAEAFTRAAQQFLDYLHDGSLHLANVLPLRPVGGLASLRTQLAGSTLSMRKKREYGRYFPNGADRTKLRNGNKMRIRIPHK